MLPSCSLFWIFHRAFALIPKLGRIARQSKSCIFIFPVSQEKIFIVCCLKAHHVAEREGAVFLLLRFILTCLRTALFQAGRLGRDEKALSSVQHLFTSLISPHPCFTSRCSRNNRRASRKILVWLF